MLEEPNRRRFTCWGQAELALLWRESSGSGMASSGWSAVTAAATLEFVAKVECFTRLFIRDGAGTGCVVGAGINQESGLFARAGLEGRVGNSGVFQWDFRCPWGIGAKLHEQEKPSLLMETAE